MPQVVPWMARALLGVLLLAATATGQTPTSAPSDAPLLTLAGEDAWFPPPTPDAEDAGRPLRRVEHPAEARAVGPRAAQSGAAGWVRTLGSLAAVLGLIVLLMWGYRAMGSAGTRLGLVGRSRNTHLLEVIARTPLSPRHSVCLVRVGPRLVLIGQGPEALSALDVIDDAALAAQLLGRSVAERDDSHAAEFERCLRDEAAQYTELPDGAPPAGPRRAKLALAGTLQRLRTRLAGLC